MYPSRPENRCGHLSNTWSRAPCAPSSQSPKGTRGTAREADLADRRSASCGLRRALPTTVRHVRDPRADATSHAARFASASSVWPRMCFGRGSDTGAPDHAAYTRADSRAPGSHPGKIWFSICFDMVRLWFDMLRYGLSKSTVFRQKDRISKHSRSIGQSINTIRQHHIENHTWLQDHSEAYRPYPVTINADHNPMEYSRGGYASDMLLRMLPSYGVEVRFIYGISMLRGMVFCEAYNRTISAIKKWEPYNTIGRTIAWVAKQV